jgi:hypothetical protein
MVARDTFQLRRFLGLAAGLVTVLAVSSDPATAEHAPQYRLEMIAQVGNVIAGQRVVGFDFEATSLALNDNREVAFFANLNDAGPQGHSVVTQHRWIAGAGKQVDGVAPQIGDDGLFLDINNAGQVVYSAGFGSGSSGLFVGDDLILRSGDMLGGRTLGDLGPAVQINDTGDVVVDARVQDAVGRSIFSQTDLLAEPGQSLAGFTLASAAYPRINNQGAVVFLANLGGNHSAVATPERVVLKSGDKIGGETISEIQWLTGITDAGEAVMIARVANDLRTVAATQSRFLFRPGDMIAGQTIIGLAETHVDLNNNNQLALIGWVSDVSGTGFHAALFAAGRQVAEVGDILNGKAIASFDPVFDLNDRGDVAFRVEFQDGSRAVVLATIPEPSSFPLALALIVVGMPFLRRNGRTACHQPTRGPNET